ncbi:hypothetical protein LCGC14_0625940 [marine sediment metagenome]|uniref:Uncharacterized protein n=1 Tax=marine sediment metagenome TaxID=412755 RepID=A0A0F9R3F0_9ZZZZ
MKAKEILEKYIKEEERENVGVIAILTRKNAMSIWYHVHEDEAVPTDQDIAVHIRYPIKP